MKILAVIFIALSMTSTLHAATLYSSKAPNGAKISKVSTIASLGWDDGRDLQLVIETVGGGATCYILKDVAAADGYTFGQLQLLLTLGNDAKINCKPAMSLEGNDTEMALSFTVSATPK